MKQSERYKKRLELYYEAEEKILGGAQSYAIGSRNLTRANLAEIRQAIRELENLVQQAEAVERGKGRNRVVGGVPRDI